MKNWQLLSSGLLLGLVFSGILFIVISSPKGEPINLAPSPTDSPLIVQITGAVVKPGVYELPADSRIRDLINAAGGFTHEAKTDSVNLAEHIRDGAMVDIETIADENIAPERIIPVEPDSYSEFFPLNINTATQEELDKLPGIGPAKAEDIIEYRSLHGDFYTIEDIMNVPGIGISIFEQIENSIVVE